MRKRQKADSRKIRGVIFKNMFREKSFAWMHLVISIDPQQINFFFMVTTIVRNVAINLHKKPMEEAIAFWNCIVIHI